MPAHLTRLNELQFLRTQLLGWYSKHSRPLPWRINPDWYHIFLSEYLLQQTRIDQGLPYFEKFIRRFPNIAALAGADEQEVLALWAGLGYYARARYMLQAARIIAQEFGGRLPDDYNLIRNLPGVGPYTAAALASLIYNQPRAAVDGNVIRVLSRVFGMRRDARLHSTKTMLNKLAARLLDPEQPGRYNQSVMELGALVCKPQNPACQECPLQPYCKAHRMNQEIRFPVKSRPPSRKALHQYVFIIQNQGKLLLARRPAKGMLASLWEFPVAPAESIPEDPQIATTLLESHFSVKGEVQKVLKIMKHDYSHIRLSYRAALAHNVAGDFPANGYAGFTWVLPHHLDRFPIHNAHQKIIRLLRVENYFPAPLARSMDNSQRE
jgi:A/G-specific adenine glycosylase